ncbi:MAG: SDR family oxidoreductase [Lewinellaceae bacterium]|nr:SDR family oxidoreductase [Lewinellaceae bacterium]
MSLKGKNAVITGGAKGIGGAATRALHREGANVVILDVDSLGGKLAEELGKGALFFKCDVSRETEVRQAMEKAVETFGDLDILVNNAGIQRYSTVTETTEEEWDLVMNVNLKSAFLCAKHAIPSMLAKGKGVVINVSSVQAFITQNNVAPYTTSKKTMLEISPAALRWTTPRTSAAWPFAPERWIPPCSAMPSSYPPIRKPSIRNVSICILPKGSALRRKWRN